MKRSAVLGRTFFRRPQVRELVPDLKLLLAVLAVSCESHCGVWVPGGLAEDTGLDPAALGGGLADLERRGLIAADPKTGEVFMTLWYRDNFFSGAARFRQWRDGFGQIQSPRLRRLVVEAIAASPECGLPPVDNLGEIDKKQGLVAQEEEKEKEKEQQQPETVVVFADGSALPSAADLAGELSEEVERAAAEGRIHGTAAAYAQGVLENWAKAGVTSRKRTAEAKAAAKVVTAEAYRRRLAASAAALGPPAGPPLPTDPAARAAAAGRLARRLRGRSP